MENVNFDKDKSRNIKVFIMSLIAFNICNKILTAIVHTLLVSQPLT